MSSILGLCAPRLPIATWRHRATRSLCPDDFIGPVPGWLLVTYEGSLPGSLYSRQDAPRSQPRRSTLRLVCGSQFRSLVLCRETGGVAEHDCARTKLALRGRRWWSTSGCFELGLCPFWYVPGYVHCIVRTNKVGIVVGIRCDRARGLVEDLCGPPHSSPFANKRASSFFLFLPFFFLLLFVRCGRELARGSKDVECRKIQTRDCQEVR